MYVILCALDFWCHELGVRLLFISRLKVLICIYRSPWVGVAGGWTASSLGVIAILGCAALVIFILVVFRF